MAKKQSNKIFCRDCGKKISILAEICPKCGVRQHSKNTKNKTTAVLLAVFLAPFNWAYTYKKDAGKFWIGLIFDLLVLITFNVLLIWVSIFIWIWAIIDSSTKDSDWYKNF